jgi:hypothetical protein
MKWSTAALSVATLSLAMLTPSLSSAQEPNDQAPSINQAAQMVPARASPTKALDANSVAAGAQFRAMLKDNVHLTGGPELRHGDTLLGEVVTDDMNTPGRAHLAVRFTQALLKNGQTVPIKATIVAVYSPSQLEGENSFNAPQQIPNDWTDQTLRVDQIGALRDVDLHSNVASQNSGVFVSTKKDDVKIPAGSELALAIAATNSAAPANSGE